MALGLDVVTLGASKLGSSNLPVVQATAPITGPDDVEQFGELGMYGSLGVTARPFPADDKGHAEGLVARDCGNGDAIIGARDTRSGAVYGKLKEGSTAIHATGPDPAAQVICAADRQVIAYTKGTDGNTIAVVVDGKNDKVQITGMGLHFEMSKDNGFVLSTGKATFQIHEGNIMLYGAIALGGPVPNANLVAANPAALSALKALVPGIMAGGSIQALPAP